MELVDVTVIVVGVLLVLLAFADLVNALVTTATAAARFLPSALLMRLLFGPTRWVASRLPADSRLREALLSSFAPILVLALLTTWASLQISGFALIWWGIGDLQSVTTGGVSSFGDALYYSGVVFFTVGFGEIVPDGGLLRAGALLEAFLGVITTALVIGYLPSLYGAYSQRETLLSTLDDGTGERITPTNLVMSWAPDADPKKLEARFVEWERWAAGILETHTTHRVLTLFRSHDPRQHWVTALGLLADAALHAQFILGAYDGAGYWYLRRASAVFEAVTADVPDHVLQPYRDRLEPTEESEQMFRQLYDQMEAHGFELVPFDVARRHAVAVRPSWAPQMEYLIDRLLAPRGFWCPEAVNFPMLSATHPEMLHYSPPERDGHSPSDPAAPR